MTSLCGLPKVGLAKLINFYWCQSLRMLDISSVSFGAPQGDPQWRSSSNVMLITAEGQLVELSVPQHLLLRSGRSHSRDLLLLRKLPHAITIGDTDLIATAFDTLQSSRIVLKVLCIKRCMHHLSMCNQSKQSNVLCDHVLWTIGLDIMQSLSLSATGHGCSPSWMSKLPYSAPFCCSNDEQSVGKTVPGAEHIHSETAFSSHHETKTTCCRICLSPRYMHMYADCFVVLLFFVCLCSFICWAMHVVYSSKRTARIYVRAHVVCAAVQ